MIQSFRSKALQALWEKGDHSQVDARLVDRIVRRLDALESASAPADMNVPGFDFHELKGKRRGTFSVHINGPWCITFGWDKADAVDVDLEQYH